MKTFNKRYIPFSIKTKCTSLRQFCRDWNRWLVRLYGIRATQECNNISHPCCLHFCGVANEICGPTSSWLRATPFCSLTVSIAYCTLAVDSENSEQFPDARFFFPNSIGLIAFTHSVTLGFVTDCRALPRLDHELFRISIIRSSSWIALKMARTRYVYENATLILRQFSWQPDIELFLVTAFF